MNGIVLTNRHLPQWLQISRLPRFLAKSCNRQADCESRTFGNDTDLPAVYNRTLPWVGAYEVAFLLCPSDLVMPSAKTIVVTDAVLLQPTHKS